MSSLANTYGSGNKIPAGYKLGQLQNFTPSQSQLFSQLFSYVSPDSNVSRLASGDQSYFDEMEAPALRQFGELQGDIASRFSGMGMGSRRGSGFRNTLNSASRNFAMDLQSQRQGLQRQALMDLMNISNNLLGQRPNNNFLIKNQNRPSFLQSLLGAASPVAGAALGGSMGGPFGMAIGGNLGSQFGSAFGGYEAPQADWTQLAGLSRSW